MEREKFSSRLGFILISAGCAIGLGNVWRFPYIVGEYGGAAFVLVYLVFLLILGLPIVVMEFAVGRASRKSAALSFDLLEPKGSRWHLTKYIAMAGNYILMMFYTTVGGWMMLYFFKTLKGDFGGMDAEAVAGEFVSMLANPALMGGFMVIVVLLCFGVCAMGLQKGVERITKVMMVCLLVLMVVLAVHSMVLPGGGPGLEFYLKPDFGKMVESGIGEAVFAALGQSFFTLSIGIGALAIFGSYIGKERTLTGEAVSVTLLDTLVAFLTEEFHLSRARAAIGLSVPMALLSAGYSLSQSAGRGINLPWFDFKNGLQMLPMNAVMEKFTDNLMIPLGALCFCLFVGWVWGTKAAGQEIAGEHGLRRMQKPWAFAVRFLADRKSVV